MTLPNQNLPPIQGEPDTSYIKLYCFRNELAFSYLDIHHVREQWPAIQSSGLNQSTLHTAYDKIHYDVQIIRQKR